MMIKSMLGGEDSVKKLIDVLSNSDALGKSLKSLVKKEKVVKEELAELYEGKTAKKFHDSLVSKSDKAVAEASEIMATVSNNSAALDVRIEEHVSRVADFQEYTRVENEKLSLREVELNVTKGRLDAIKSDLNERDEQLRSDAVEVERMREEYDAKLLKLNNSVAQLNS